MFIIYTLYGIIIFQYVVSIEVDVDDKNEIST